MSSQLVYTSAGNWTVLNEGNCAMILEVALVIQGSCGSLYSISLSKEISVT